MKEADKVENHAAQSPAPFDFTTVFMQSFHGKTTDDLIVEFDEDDAPYEPRKGGGFI